MPKLPDLILFDMDGVVTSERGYWNASASTVANILYSPDGIGINHISWRQANSLEKCLEAALPLMPDSVISSLKSKAINTNWDLTVIVLGWHLLDLLGHHPSGYKKGNNFACFQFPSQESLRKTEDLAHAFYSKYPQATGYEILSSMDAEFSEILGRPETLFTREGWLWNEAYKLFQKWFLGGITKNGVQLEGLIQGEQPVVPLSKLKDTFEFLKKREIPLGIATGRTRYEIETPLRNWGLMDYFLPNHFVTHDEVHKGEEELRENGISEPLSKPNPFPFLRAIYPDAGVLSLFRKEYNIANHSSIWVVGDTVGDIRGGRQIGCRTIGVLTGVAGQAGRITLKDAKVDDILDSVLDLPQLIMRGS